jgi:E3 ubiquitin-protein ligase TRIP12
MNSIRAGFSSIIPWRHIKGFSPVELALLLCGEEEELDVNSWRKNTVYENGYNADTQCIKWFWSVVEEFSAREKTLLLHFVTGTPRLPPGGF